MALLHFCSFHSAETHVLVTFAFIPMFYCNQNNTSKYTLGHFNPGSTFFWREAACSEKVMAPHSSTPAWKIPWTEEPGALQSMGSQRVGHNWATSLFFLFYCWQRHTDCCCYCGFLSLFVIEYNEKFHLRVRKVERQFFPIQAYILSSLKSLHLRPLRITWVTNSCFRMNVIYAQWVWTSCRALRL